jgi:hypothetical protein
VPFPLLHDALNRPGVHSPATSWHTRPSTCSPTLSRTHSPSANRPPSAPPPVSRPLHPPAPIRQVARHTDAVGRACDPCADPESLPPPPPVAVTATAPPVLATPILAEPWPHGGAPAGARPPPYAPSARFDAAAAAAAAAAGAPPQPYLRPAPAGGPPAHASPR